MRASLDPPISCSSSTDPSQVAVLTESGIRKGFVSPPFLSCTPRNTCRLLSTLSRGTKTGCSVAPSVTNGSSNSSDLFSSSFKRPSLANVLVVTDAVSIGFVSPAFRIFSAPLSSAKACNRSFLCPRVRSNAAMTSASQCRPRGLIQRFLGIQIAFPQLVNRLLLQPMVAAPRFKIKARHNKKKIAMYANNVERPLVPKKIIQSRRKFACTARAQHGISAAVFNCD